MRCYETHVAELARAWEGVEAALSALAEPLQGEAQRWLSHIAGAQPEGEHPHRRYFRKGAAPPLVFLPLWLSDGLAAAGCAVSPDILDAVLQATMFGYFAVRLQDDVLDEADAPRTPLLLGNYCSFAMHEHFGRATGDDPAFRAAFARAWTAFSGWTLAEHERVRSDVVYTERDFRAHSDKVAFARVPLLAVAFAAGRSDLEPDIAALIHGLGVSYGLTNDLGGWRRDMANGHRTYLLARAGWGRADGLAAAPEIAAQLYDEGLAIATLSEARQALEAAGEVADRVPFDGFQDYLTERKEVLAQALKDVRMIQLQRALTGQAAEASP